ncbi:two component transcriptional regulator, LytTR family [Chitinophaga terrae (ex Kim and Jung 2007)]|uniref:Two component transcriptional regulator, LytTR family n=1 Tax=Chitinophaga terrae (ex Kim and Jung 2007) TaxID=408074 RepID=A0A1H4GDU9_9BACT|nr:LytTR family DNA-binding domain-containing protein [Chitinophaga terrae (ex Kim and Jung 2007)]GEP93279.1 DNA-binding response regulator [Chitinophaga terrae (ex Kim and Jung 2007)]SEB07078.1 two component transcriptional regulator, LytTR family [Chitinophaga terrae (ex Kim and Jung 2007)]
MPALSALIRVVIVEDQPIVRNDIKALVESHEGFIVVGQCATIEEGYVLLTTTLPDLVLLDIELGTSNSFELLEQLESLPFSIIFLTAYESFAIRAIKFGAMDYLLKPVNEQEFHNALSKVTQKKETDRIQVAVVSSHYKKPNNRLVLRSQTFIQVVDLPDIIYCKSDSGYTTFFLADGRKVVTSRYIKEYQEMLPANMFLRPHQSYVVGLRYIDRYQRELGGGNIILKNGTVIPVASRKKDMVIAAITQKL